MRAVREASVCGMGLDWTQGIQGGEGKPSRFWVAQNLRRMISSNSLGLSEIAGRNGPNPMSGYFPAQKTDYPAAGTSDPIRIYQQYNQAPVDSSKYRPEYSQARAYGSTAPQAPFRGGYRGAYMAPRVPYSSNPRYENYMPRSEELPPNSNVLVGGIEETWMRQDKAKERRPRDLYNRDYFSESNPSVWTMPLHEAQNKSARLDFASPNEVKMASQVAAEFAYHYFHLMQTQPQMLHCFYCADSQVAHGSSILTVNRWNRAVGETEIEVFFRDLLKFEGSNTSLIQRSHVKTLEAQPTKEGGIVMQATGVVETRDLGARPFAHTIVMHRAPEAGSYVVLHDIFVFLDDLTVETNGAAGVTLSRDTVPATTQTSKQDASTSPLIEPDDSTYKASQPEPATQPSTQENLHLEPEEVDQASEYYSDDAAQEAEMQETLGEDADLMAEGEEDEQVGQEDEEPLVETETRSEPPQESLAAPEDHQVEEQSEEPHPETAQWDMPPRTEPQWIEPPEAPSAAIEIEEEVAPHISEPEIIVEHPPVAAPKPEEAEVPPPPPPPPSTEPEPAPVSAVQVKPVKTSPWKTVAPPPPTAVSRPVDEPVSVSTMNTSIRASAPAAAAPAPIISPTKFTSNSYAARLLTGVTDGPKQRGTVFKRASESASTSPSTQEQPSSDNPAGKAIWVSQLEGISDAQIEKAVEMRLKGCPVEGRVVRIERMKNGPAGVIELDSEDCVPMLLERGLCLGGRDVRIDLYKQSSSREPSPNQPVRRGPPTKDHPPQGETSQASQPAQQQPPQQRTGGRGWRPQRGGWRGGASRPQANTVHGQHEEVPSAPGDWEVAGKGARRGGARGTAAQRV